MVKHWVVNASSIISLAKIDRIYRLSELSELSDQIVIPKGVAAAQLTAIAKYPKLLKPLL